MVKLKIFHVNWKQRVKKTSEQNCTTLNLMYSMNCFDILSNIIDIANESALIVIDEVDEIEITNNRLVHANVRWDVHYGEMRFV